MHYVIALLYGFTLWLGAVLFCLILTPDLAHIAILACPLIVSGSMVVILALDWAIWRAVAALVRLWHRLV